MSDKERNASSEERGLGAGFRVERAGETNVSEIENQASAGLFDQPEVPAPADAISSPAEKMPTGSETGRAVSSGDGQAGDAPAGKRSLVAELASHLGESRSDFHESKRFISRCRRRFRAARF